MTDQRTREALSAKLLKASDELQAVMYADPRVPPTPATIVALMVLMREAAALLLVEAAPPANIRTAEQDAVRQVAYLRNVCVLFHNALTGHMMAGRFNHQLCDRADDLWVAYDDAEIANAPLPPQEKQ